MVGAIVDITESSFERCYSAGEGGALWASQFLRYPNVPLNSSVQMTNVKFSNNSAGKGGAVSLEKQTLANITKCVFDGNAGINSGGALAIHDESNTTIKASRFEKNKAFGIGGGALHVSDSLVDLFVNNFTGNEAKTGGGGAVLWDGEHPPDVRMACDPGWWAGHLGKSGELYCVKCSPGWWKSTIEAARCTACEVGKFCNVSGGTDIGICKSCPTGTFQSCQDHLSVDNALKIQDRMK